MALLSDGYRTSLTTSPQDSDRGSLRKLVQLLGRAYPNSFVASSRQTHATGTTYVALASAAAVRITGPNNTGTSLTFRRVAAPSVTFAVASGAAVDLVCVANASEWEVKRTDDSNTQVTLAYLLNNTV